jgi:cytochrome c-type biogenesis protein CcmH
MIKERKQSPGLIAKRCAILAQMNRLAPSFLIFLVLTLLLFAFFSPQQGRVVAQDAISTSIATPTATPILVVTPEGITADQVNVVARQLWCPLCNGVRLDACELKACAQMRDVIAIKLGEGESSESIQEYFLQAYGPQVLGRPPFEGFSWLAWLLPPLVLIAGGALVWTRVRSMVRPTDAPQTTTPDGPALPPDTYADRLEEELKNHE